MGFARKWMAALIAGTMLLAAKAAPAEEATLIITGDLAPFYPVLTDADVGKPAVELEKELKRLRDEEKDAVFIDAGNHLSISNSLETAYTLFQAELFDEIGYSIVNLSARDAAMATVGQIGYQVAPKDYLEPIITNLRSTEPKALDVPAVKSVTTDGMKLTFLSLEDKTRAGALSSNISFLDPAPASEIKTELEKAENSGGVLVAFSSLNELSREDYFRDLGRRPDVLIDSYGERGGGARDANGLWVIGAPASGEVLEINLEKDGGSLVIPKVTRHRYVDEEAIEQIIKYPKPMLGLPLPNLEEVMSQYFAMSSNAVRVDTVPVAGLEEYTSLGEDYSVHIYHVSVDGEELRVYRNFSRMKDWSKSGRYDGGWPLLDMLVLVSKDHVLRGIVMRNSFPIMGRQTTVSEALNKLAGRDPSTWYPDPLLASGLEELWGWAANDLRTILKLDQRLYGPGGVLNTGGN